MVEWSNSYFISFFKIKINIDNIKVELFKYIEIKMYLYKIKNSPNQ